MSQAAEGKVRGGADNFVGAARRRVAAGASRPRFEGGLILPGARACLAGLSAQAPALPLVEPLPPDATGPTPVIRRGTGQVINKSAASAPPPRLGGTSGAATFNFEGESLPAVVKAILGDMLGQNYVIAPGVQGTVTLATPKPVSPAEAMSLLVEAGFLAGPRRAVLRP